MSDAQPSGTVTLVFTDVEGSTKLLEELGTDGYRDALGEHRRVVREAFGAHGGYEVDYEGDAFFYAFASAQAAVSAVSDAMVGLEPGPIRIRVGIHTGDPALDPPKYVGIDVHRAARIMSAAHGGQVVLSPSTVLLLEPGTFELIDLGEHRLKDIEGAIPIFQLGAGSFPPLKTISNTNLPRPASSFVGRETELSGVLTRVEGGARLVTLTGPGGTGKTRLALEAASSLVPEYKAGVFWVGLASLRDPALVTEMISQTLGAKDGLAEHIAERELLLLLDNLEQVIEVAPELSALLSACPNLTLLVTSRELLRVQGEVEYPVPPLAEPEAISLFCERAQIDPSEEIAELCARLDSLPLAIELAAARVKALSPAQILERLSQRLDMLKGGRDADPRQQTLRSTIEWSYDLLSEEEQQLFTRLSVFVGGCTLDAAEEVCDANLDSLQSLVEKSLLRFTNQRYWMLETIREFAAERFENVPGAEDLRWRHADHFLAFAEKAEPNLRGNPGVWLKHLEREQDNMRAALDFFEAAGEPEPAMRLAGALSRFWASRGYVSEGSRRLESALRTDKRPTTARARALNGAALIALGCGDAATARSHAEEAAALHESLGDPSGFAHARFFLGHVVAEEGDFLQAQQLFEESERRFGELGDEHFALHATRSLAWTYEELGDREQARTLREDNLRRARATGNQQIEARSLSALGFYAVEEGAVEQGLPMMKESLRISRDLDDFLGITDNLSRFARAFAIQGRADTAARLLSRWVVLHEETGANVRPYVTNRNEATLTIIRARLDDVAFAEAWEQGRFLSVEEAVALALNS